MRSSDNMRPPKQRLTNPHAPDDECFRPCSNRMIAAFEACPRGEFVPREYEDEAYIDSPLRLEEHSFNVSAPHSEAAAPWRLPVSCPPPSDSQSRDRGGRELLMMMSYAHQLQLQLNGYALVCLLSWATAVHAMSLEAMDIQPGHRVLDIGCGCGVVSAICAFLVTPQPAPPAAAASGPVAWPLRFISEASAHSASWTLLVSGQY